MSTERFTPLKRATPASQNIPELALEDFFTALGNCDARMRSCMVLRGGKVVGEKFWSPYRPEDRVWVYSISKSFTSTAVGFAIDEGKLSLEDKVVSFFPDRCPAEISENLAKMTLRDLLSMTSGHEEDTALALLASLDGDWVRTFLSLEVERVPGTWFVYNSGASFIVSAIVEKATGEKLVDYLTPRLFEPLGFDAVEWDESPFGIAAGGWGIVLRLEDLAKLGQLYLNKGVYEGRRILSENWINEATRKQSDNSNHPEPFPDWVQGYGLHFWRCQHNGFRADGAAGQYCIVLPEQDAVVAIMSEVLIMQTIMDIVWEKLLPIFDTASSPVESEINDKVYRLEQNHMGFESAQLSFSEEGVGITFTGASENLTLSAGRGVWADNELILPFGTRSVFPQFSLGGSLKSLSATFIWSDENTLEVTWYYRQTPHTDRMLCVFHGSDIELIWPPNALAMMVGMEEYSVNGCAE